MNRMRRHIPATLAVAALLVVFSPVLGLAQAASPAPAPVMVVKIAANLSTKNAKVGDSVTGKITKAYKLQDGTEIPKGSKIVGKVDTVQSKKAGNGNSMLSFRLDQIEVKGGAAIPVHGFVVAIGPSMAPKVGLGGNSVLSRNVNAQSGTGVTAAGQGTGSSSGLDPSAGLGTQGAKDEDDIAMGSTMPGVALGRHLDADWTTVLKGVHTDIDLDSDVVIKVQLK
ncbi:MAG: hypothetical protein ABR987_07525 [Terracidiphilus sp.]